MPKGILAAAECCVGSASGLAGLTVNSDIPRRWAWTGESAGSSNTKLARSEAMARIRHNRLKGRRGRAAGHSGNERPAEHPRDSLGQGMSQPRAPFRRWAKIRAPQARCAGRACRAGRAENWTKHFADTMSSVLAGKTPFGYLRGLRSIKDEGANSTNVKTMRSLFVTASTCVAGALLAGTLFVGSATAQQADISAAANAFSKAQQAEVSGDSSRAADLYELADRIAPTPQALRAATRARLAAGQLASGALNAEALQLRYPEDAGSLELATLVLDKANATLARIAVECSTACGLLVNRLAASTSSREQHVVYVQSGSQTLTVKFDDGTSQTQRIEVSPGQKLEAQFSPPERAAPAPTATPAPEPTLTPGPDPVKVAPAPVQEESSGLSPVVFYTGLGATVLAGAAATWSGLDTLDSKDDFTANPTQAGFDSGNDKDTRTTILIATAGALAVGTTVIAFFTDWSPGADTLEASAVVVPGAGHIQLSGRF
jgi:hypothetical protein